MKILFTGASSFTGYWFCQALSAAGHEVVAPLLRPRASYSEGIRAERVRRLGSVAEIVEEAPFGGERFMAVLRSGRFDLLCHHAAHVGDYRSLDFDVAAALSENTANLRAVLGELAHGGGRGVVLTGSFFEQNEGAGDAPLAAFSPYGLSKGLTAQVVAYRVREFGLPYGKFVIPNPFGPLEEPRFCAYLIRLWKQGEVARVNTPDYVRDNINVGLLSLAYIKFVGEVAKTAVATKLNPSGYVESQGQFANRFAAAMRSRLSLPCELAFGTQTDFGEPLMRVNTESAVRYVGSWDEGAAWDAVAAAYSEV